jgi:hypothetical protein
MRYEEFLDTWTEALQKSRLPMLGAFLGETTLDLRSLDRRYEVYLEPLGGQDAKPFHVAVKLAWEWDAMTTARNRSTEEDALRDVLGVTRKASPRTVQPWLRVDVALSATVPEGGTLPMPSQSRWSSWVREVGERLDSIERLVPEETYRVNKRGMPEVFAFQSEPRASFKCGPGGELLLERVDVKAWQAIKLPRAWDDPARKPDAPPDRELKKLFQRVRAAAYAWNEALDHLATAKDNAPR